MPTVGRQLPACSASQTPGGGVAYELLCSDPSIFWATSVRWGSTNMRADVYLTLLSAAIHGAFEVASALYGPVT